MRMLSVLLIPLVFPFVLGCDGDGGDDTATTETAGEETETVEGPQGPITIVTGSETADYSEPDPTIPFTIPETGLIEAKVEWNSPPSKLQIGLYHGSGVGVDQPSIQSPAVLQLEATQDLLDMSNEWAVIVSKGSGEDVTFHYTVRLFPD